MPQTERRCALPAAAARGLGVHAYEQGVRTGLALRDLTGGSHILFPFLSYERSVVATRLTNTVKRLLVPSGKNNTPKRKREVAGSAPRGSGRCGENTAHFEWTPGAKTDVLGMTGHSGLQRASSYRLI